MLLVPLLAASAPTALAEDGTATWYGQPYHGRRMANGQVYDMYDPTTTACNAYPLGTWLRVTNPANGREVVVQVRDRGLFRHALDLSYAAFAKIADPHQMKLQVRYELVSGPDGSGEQPAATPPPTPAETSTPEAAAPAAAAPQPVPDSGSYEVQPGETLAAIAGRFDLDPAALAAWNGLDDPNLLHAGQSLVLVAPDPPPAAAAAPTAAPAASAGAYVVQDGDTLWQIAERFGLTTGALIEANGLSPDATILPGQELSIPGGVVEAAAAPTAPQDAEEWYTVTEGDTLAGIAERAGTTVEALLALNGLADGDLIQPGQRLRIH